MVNDEVDNVTLAQLINLLYEHEELDTKYHYATENCQNFTKKVFDKLASTRKLEYGWLLRTSIGLYRKASGLRDPPQNLAGPMN